VARTLAQALSHLNIAPKVTGRANLPEAAPALFMTAHGRQYY